MKKIIFCLFFFNLYCSIDFNRLDLNIKNNLFVLSYTDYKNHSVLANIIDKNEIEYLSYYNKRVNASEQNLLIENEYGIFLSSDNKSFKKLKLQGHNFVLSKDGKYILYQKNKELAYVDIFLYDIGKDKEYLISNVQESIKDIYKFSYYSDYFFYQKANKIYYYNIFELSNLAQDEEKRLIGPGKIANIFLTTQDYIFYILKNKVYKIKIYNISQYNNTLDYLELKYTLPFDFNDNFDIFRIFNNTLFISLKGKQIYIQNDKDIFFYKLEYTKQIKDIISFKDKVYYIIKNYKNDDYYINIFDESLKKSQKFFKDALNIIVANKNKIDIDSKYIAVIFKDKTEFYTMDNLKKIYSLDDKINDFIQNKQDNLLAFTNKVAYNIILNNGSYKKEFLFFTSIPKNDIDDIFFDPNNDLVLSSKINFKKGSKLKFKDNHFSFISTEEYNNLQKDKRDYNNLIDFKITENKDSIYKNMLSIDNIKFIEDKKFKTICKTNTEKDTELQNNLIFKLNCDKNKSNIFLVFNIYSLDGIYNTIDILERYNIKAIFFVTKYFINDYNYIIDLLLKKKHEIGLLIMDSQKYLLKPIDIENRIKKMNDIIKIKPIRLWHNINYNLTPYMMENIKGLKKYPYISRSLDNLDWVPKYSNYKNYYYNSSDIIKHILASIKSGYIIPISIGDNLSFDPYEVDKKRDDYLFSKLELLLNYIIAYGYDINLISEYL